MAFLSKMKSCQIRVLSMFWIGKQFVGSEVYDDLLSRFSKGNINQKQTIQSFYEALAGLKIETQDECFEALVEELSDFNVYGFVVDRLKEGNDI